MQKKGMGWFRFHADWIDNPKVQMLDATLQQRYVTLLCLRCKGELPGLAIETIAWYMRISADECRETLEKLQSCGLWTGDDVPNWDERQYISDCSTERSRKHREATRKRQCNDDATLQQPPQSQRTDPELKNPPTPRKRVDAGDVERIVNHLNTITGKHYSTTLGNKEIERALKRGKTVDECIEVINHCWGKWRADPKMIGHVDKTTPFRESNFDRYLDESRAGTVNRGGGWNERYA